MYVRLTTHYRYYYHHRHLYYRHFCCRYPRPRSTVIVHVWTRSYIITNLTSTATMTTTTSIGSTRLIGDRRVGLALKFSYLIRYSGKKNSSLPPLFPRIVFGFKRRIRLCDLSDRGGFNAHRIFKVESDARMMDGVSLRFLDVEYLEQRAMHHHKVECTLIIREGREEIRTRLLSIQPDIASRNSLFCNNTIDDDFTTMYIVQYIVIDIHIAMSDSNLQLIISRLVTKKS